MNISSVLASIAAGDVRQVQANDSLGLTSSDATPALPGGEGNSASPFSSLLSQLLPKSNGEAAVDIAQGESENVPAASVAPNTAPPASDAKVKVRLSDFASAGMPRLNASQDGAESSVVAASTPASLLLARMVNLPGTPSGATESGHGIRQQAPDAPEPAVAESQPSKPEPEVAPAPLLPARPNFIERPALPAAIAASDVLTRTLKESNPNSAENVPARPSTGSSRGDREEPQVQATETPTPEIAPTVPVQGAQTRKPKPEALLPASEHPNFTETAPVRPGARESHGDPGRPTIPVEVAQTWKPEHEAPLAASESPTPHAPVVPGGTPRTPGTRPAPSTQVEMAQTWRPEPEIPLAVSTQVELAQTRTPVSEPQPDDSTPRESDAGETSQTTTPPLIDTTGTTPQALPVAFSIGLRRVVPAESTPRRNAPSEPSGLRASSSRQIPQVPSENAVASNLAPREEIQFTTQSRISDPAEPRTQVTPVQGAVVSAPAPRTASAADELPARENPPEPQLQPAIARAPENVTPVTNDKRPSDPEADSQDRRRVNLPAWVPAQALKPEPNPAPERTETEHLPANSNRQTAERVPAAESVHGGAPLTPADTQVAFTGRLIERTAPETEVSSAATPEPARRPVLERVTQESESDGQTRQPVENERPALHAEPAVTLPTIHREASSSTPPRQVVETVPAARTANSEPLHESVPRQAPGPVREISMRIGDPAQESAHLRVVERGGEVLVSVRSGSEQLARTLSGGLGELTHHLEQSGFQTELWRPAGQSSGSDLSRDRDSASTAGQSQDQPSPASRRDSQDQSERNPQEPWDELDESLSFS